MALYLHQFDSKQMEKEGGEKERCTESELQQNEDKMKGTLFAISKERSPPADTWLIIVQFDKRCTVMGRVIF